MFISNLSQDTFLLVLVLIKFRLMNEECNPSSHKETDLVEGESKKLNKLGKCRSRVSRLDSSLDYGVDGDGDQPGQGTTSSREEKVNSLKTVRFIFNLL